MFNLIKKIFGKRDAFNKEGVMVKLAFTVGGIDYYEVEDIFSLNYQRGIQAVRIYDELKNKCDFEYLKAYYTAINNLFEAKQSLGIKQWMEVKKLNDRLGERLYKIAIDPDLVYKLASVVFFDKHESPLDYDWAYARKKIDHWKKHKTVGDFFLQEPLTRLVPSLKLPAETIESYMETIRKFNQIDWEEVFTMLTNNQKKEFSAMKDFYAGAMQPEFQN